MKNEEINFNTKEPITEIKISPHIQGMLSEDLGNMTEKKKKKRTIHSMNPLSTFKLNIHGTSTADGCKPYNLHAPVLTFPKHALCRRSTGNQASTRSTQRRLPARRYSGSGYQAAPALAQSITPN